MKQFISRDLLIKYIFIELRMKVNAFIGAPIRDLPDNYLGQFDHVKKAQRIFRRIVYEIWNFPF